MVKHRRSKETGEYVVTGRVGEEREGRFGKGLLAIIAAPKRAAKRRAR
jgi:hypothetical protein